VYVAVRSVRLFRNGRNQAVRIPRDLELPGQEALIRKEGDALILEPKRPGSLLAVLKRLRPIRDAFPAVERLPAEDVEL
jgi:antitoxin VapB